MYGERLPFFFFFYWLTQPSIKVGPFRFIREAVVRACIQEHTFYVAITRESGFIEDYMLKCRTAAKVHACRLGSISTDMGPCIPNWMMGLVTPFVFLKQRVSNFPFSLEQSDQLFVSSTVALVIPSITGTPLFFMRSCYALELLRRVFSLHFFPVCVFFLRLTLWHKIVCEIQSLGCNSRHGNCRIHMGLSEG